MPKARIPTLDGVQNCEQALYIRRGEANALGVIHFPDQFVALNHFSRACV